MKSWSRRIEIFVFAGALVVLPSFTAHAASARAIPRSARIERQEIQPGLLPAALSYVRGLLARALAVVAPGPGGPVLDGTTGNSGNSDVGDTGSRSDNGAGIDPNGG